jgi:hypothetical protein
MAKKSTKRDAAFGGGELAAMTGVLPGGFPVD